MHRRRFLSGVGASLLVAAGGLAAIQPRRSRVPGESAGLPERVPTPRRVVVIGGGLAGIAAASELAGRGFQVTLVEQGSELGGKLGGWQVRALGEDFPVEHGFHGFFAQYYSLAQLLAAAGADGDLIESAGYPVPYGDRVAERFGRTTTGAGARVPHRSLPASGRRALPGSSGMPLFVALAAGGPIALDGRWRRWTRDWREPTWW